MIKRWIARRRRRLDLYGRMRQVEARAADLGRGLSSISEQVSHEADLSHAALREQAAQLIDLIERRAEGVSMLQHRLGSLQDRFDDLDARTRDAAEALEQRIEDQRAAVGDLEERVASMAVSIDRLNIRQARLEAQRQIDIEEARRLSLITLQELKRSVIRWRGPGEALETLDRLLPSRRYIGRPSEERSAERLRPSLSAGVAVQAGTENRLHMAPLTPEGAVDDRHPPPTTLEADALVAFAPAGSLVSPNFARLVLEYADRNPDASVFYADDFAVETEEAIDQLRLKPEFDLTLLSAQDYIGAPLIIRASALGTLKGLDPAAGTAACADLLFRAHAQDMLIRRIPEVLLAHPGTRVRATATDYAQMLRRQDILAPYEVRSGAVPQTFRLERCFTAESAPNVTLLVPTRRTAPLGSNEAYVERLLDSVSQTDWPMEKLTVIVGDDLAGTPDWALKRWPFTFVRLETQREPHEAFNYAAKMNQLWRAAESEQIIFLNDDVRMLDGGWLKALQTFALDPSVGGVGAKLLFEDGSLQHVGMGPHGRGAAHLWIQRLGGRGFYQNWAQVHREWSMVTGAVFATRRTLMEQVSGFDERFSLEFNDTDLSMRLREAGYRIVCTPFAQMVHVERASRGGRPPPREEEALFHARWDEWLANDPSWHPRLDRSRVEVMPVADPDAWYL